MATFYAQVNFKQQQQGPEKEAYNNLLNILDTNRLKVHELWPQARVTQYRDTSMIIGEGKLLDPTAAEMKKFVDVLNLDYIDKLPFINTQKYYVSFVTPDDMPDLLKHRNCKYMLVLVSAEHTTSAVNYYIFNKHRANLPVYEKSIREGGLFAMFPIAEFTEYMDTKVQSNILQKLRDLFPKLLVGDVPKAAPRRDRMVRYPDGSLSLHSLTINWMNGDGEKRGLTNMEVFWDGSSK